MTKYYFVSYVSKRNGILCHGCTAIMVKNLTLKDICAAISDNLGLDCPVTVTCLKDLSTAEFEMLGGIKVEAAKQL